MEQAKGIAPTNHFQESVEALILDWKGQDEMFYHDRSMRTIIWYLGKVKSYLAVEKSAEMRANRGKFMEAVCAAYGMEKRRLQEALQVYKHYSHPSDSLKETCERIFLEEESWSKALKKLAVPKPEKKEVEPPDDCNHIFVCNRCGREA